MRPIKNMTDLREALANGHRVFKIHLCGGQVFSCKHIVPFPEGHFGLINYVDHKTTLMTARQLLRHCNIGKAMKLGAFTTE